MSFWLSRHRREHHSEFNERTAALSTSISNVRSIINPLLPLAVSRRYAKSLSLLSLTDPARPERPAAIETIQNQYDSPLIITKYAFMKQQEHGKNRQKIFWTFTTITTQRNDTLLYLQQHSTLRRSRIWLLDLETRNTASVLSFIDFYDLHQRVAMILFNKDLNFSLAICFLARERASTQPSTTLCFWFWISA